LVDSHSDPLRFLWQSFNEGWVSFEGRRSKELWPWMLGWLIVAVHVAIESIVGGITFSTVESDSQTNDVFYFGFQIILIFDTMPYGECCL
jgi:uncharacterized membrane protein YhaH (DUF805 family)